MEEQLKIDFEKFFKNSSFSSKNISLKKYGGSQLMSGGQAETLATLGFAYDKAPSSI